MSNSSSSNSKDAIMASLMSGGGSTNSNGNHADPSTTTTNDDNGAGSSGTTNDPAPKAPTANSASVPMSLFSNDDENGEDGLFSDLPINNNEEVTAAPVAPPLSPPATAGIAPSPPQQEPLPAPVLPAPPKPSSLSLLEQSGLLSGPSSVATDVPEATTESAPFAPSSGGGGGGLFDDIDEEERRREQEELERAKAAAEEERRRQEEQERLRLEDENRQRQLQEQAQRQQEEERRRQEEALALQQQQAQQQQQLQQLQYGMQTVHLTNNNSCGVNPTPTNAAYSAPVYGNVVSSQSQYGQPNAMMSTTGYTPSSLQQQSVYGQQQQQPPFQSTPLSYPQQPPPEQQQSQNPLYASDPQQLAGFYRDSAPSQYNPSMMAPPSRAQPSNVYGGGSRYQHTSSMLSSPARGGVGAPPPGNLGVGSPHAGMYNINPNLGVVSQAQAQASPSHRFPPTAAAPAPPPPPPTLPFGKILVSEPLLISASGSSLFGIRQPPHWSYQIQTQFETGSNWLVRRRFRHVVALEERIRQECPGAILPPRPEKHATRALEEATAHQSADFAMQRALELQCYLNSLMVHPYASKSHALRLFLSLQDDLGTAWAEVSSNALTRLANVGVGAAMSLSETTARGMGVFQQDDYLPEDSAELLALQSSEATRMGAVMQAVPKLEGCVTLLKEHADQMGVVGMELQKAKSMEDLQPFEILANGMLRSSRRTKRGIAELTAAMHTFSYHYKLVRYEKLAFADRKHALIQRAKERGKADQRAAQLIMQQRQYGNYNNNYANGLGLDRLEREAAVSDEIATDTVQECEEIGRRIKVEVARIAYDRRTEWRTAVKLVANAMKEATIERQEIWSSVREQFLNAHPDLR